MTHYAFATALMNLMLVPTTMISGPLAEALGFSTFFIVVMFASVPSVWAAWKAPFPLATDGKAEQDAAGNEHPGTITVDDPTRLTAGQRAVQLIAGRASIHAMLNILTILVVDAKILGMLEGRAAGRALLPLVLLVGSAAFKLFLTVRTYQIARQAAAEAARTGEDVYRKNARGAKIATLVCAVVSVTVLVAGAKLAL
jgi:PAT family beta-lactamase induction signal transducer AmpG